MPNHNYSYPVKRNGGQSYNVVPRLNSNNFNMPTIIIPKYANKNHSVAGQIKTKIHLKNARGDVMDIYQAQHMLNLHINDKKNWSIHSNSGANNNTRNKGGKRNVYKR